MRTRCMILTSLLLIWLPVAITAAEYHVKQDGTGDFATIQAAIDAVVDGDAVLVHPGAYYECVRFGGKNVVLRSTAPDDWDVVAATAIDGDYWNGPVITFDGSESETCQLMGFTITNGRGLYGAGINGCGGEYNAQMGTHAGISHCAISSNVGVYGGGLLACDGSISDCLITSNFGTGLMRCNATIENCIITGNFEGYDGGGLKDCDGMIRNCAITGNSAGMNGGALSACDGSISNCTITGNSAGEDGGGLFSCGGSITDCAITSNSAGGCGGGLMGCYGGISCCEISGNTAAAGGGLCMCYGSVIYCCTISRNVASNGGGLDGCSGSIDNCVILGNLALYGGGMCGCNVLVNSCTISANSAGEDGGGLCWIDGSISNCIVWGNYAPNGPDLFHSDAKITHSCIQGWTEGGQGNFDADPLFVSGPQGDYYLSQRAAGQELNSPCVDTGSMLAVEAGLAEMTTRTDGIPDLGTVDIGYHYPAPFMLPEVWVSTAANTYSHGDTLEIVFEAVNPNPFSYPVDLYAAVIMGDGVIWTIDAGWNWSASLNPWFVSLELPANFTFGPTTLLSIELPSAMPPISDLGTYWVAAAFADVGTTTFIGEPSISAFELVGD